MSFQTRLHHYDQSDISKLVNPDDERTNHRRDRISPGVCDASYLSDDRCASADGDKRSLDESFERLHGKAVYTLV